MQHCMLLWHVDIPYVTDEPNYELLKKIIESGSAIWKCHSAIWKNTSKTKDITPHKNELMVELLLLAWWVKILASDGGEVELKWGAKWLVWVWWRQCVAKGLMRQAGKRCEAYVMQVKSMAPYNRPTQVGPKCNTKSWEWNRRSWHAEPRGAEASGHGARAMWAYRTKPRKLSLWLQTLPGSNTALLLIILT